MIQDIESKREEGFTLIELLIAIVVVGILAAVVIVGINGLTTTGNKSACKTSMDAASAAAAVHYATPQGPADNETHAYPARFIDMTTTTPPELVPPSPSSWSGDGQSYSHSGWVLKMVPGADSATAPTFTCTP